jgi:hypothetical protein
MTIAMKESLIAWRGPDSVSVPGINPLADDAWFVGHRILHLALRRDEPTTAAERLLASRSVYARLYDDSQEIAVLRAMSWSRIGQREDFKIKGPRSPLAFPVRYTSLPLETAHSWLTRFEGLSATIDMPHLDESADPSLIRTLRLEPETVTCSFEKTWLVHDQLVSELDQPWIEVWNEMTELLADSTLPESIEENYRSAAPKVAGYDVTSDIPNHIGSDGRPNDR